MTIMAIIAIIALGIAGWAELPEPLNFLALTVVAMAGLWHLLKESPEPTAQTKLLYYDRHPHYIEHRRYERPTGAAQRINRPSHVPPVSATKLKAVGLPHKWHQNDHVSVQERNEEMAIKPKRKDNDKQCMKCHTWVFNGLTMNRGSDEFFVCYRCRNEAHNQLEELFDDIRKQWKDDNDPVLELNLSEEELLVVDELLQQHHVQDDIKIDSVNVARLTVYDVKRKVHMMADTVRSGRHLVSV